MNVIQLLYHDRIGGQEKSVIRLCLGLRDAGICDVALGFCEPDGVLIHEARRLGIRTLSFGHRHGVDPTVIPRVRSMLEEFDIHHFHVLNIPLILASRQVAHASRVFTERSGQLTHFGLKKTIFNHIYGHYLRRSFHACTANTRHGLKKLERAYGVTERTFVTYNGLDFENIRRSRPREETRQTLGLGNGDFVVGSAGRLAEVKRLDRLIRALSTLAPPGIKCLLVGDGPMRSSLANQAERAGLKDRVIFSGMLANPYDAIGAMDLIVLPTREAGFENALVEAMALQVPGIVFSDVGGAAEHISSGEDGYVVQDERELAARVRELAGDPERVRAMGKRAREKVIARYTMKNYIQAYVDVYRTVMPAMAGQPTEIQ